MKLIIDIPNKIYNALTHTEFDANLVVGEMRKLRKSIANGTPIPDNATNGDIVKSIMKAVMPYAVLFEENAKVDDEEFVCMYCCGESVGDFSINWWNSPYQKGGK